MSTNMINSRSSSKDDGLKMMQMPNGTKHLTGNLYMIPFASIRSPQNNPRLLTEQGLSLIHI